MIIKYYSKFFQNFKENRKNFIKYSSLSFVAGVLELCGVALTYPFVLKLLSGSNEKYTIILGLGIVLLFLAKNIFMIFYNYLQAKFTKTLQAEVNLKFMQYFLWAPYKTVSEISFAQKSNIFGCLIPQIINNYILRLLNLNVNLFIFALISTFLVIKFPLATLITVVFAFLLIFVQNKFFKKRLEDTVKDLTKTSVIYNQSTNEALLNLKSVKISNNEKFFFDNYKNAISKFYKIETNTLFLNTIPPYITEPFIIILLFILLAVISFQNYAEPQKLIASFALIVSAIFRLAPTIARIQVNLNGIHSAIPIVEEFLQLYDKLDVKNAKELENKSFAKFNDSIDLVNVSFEYTLGNKVLNNINLKIKKGEFIGIAGLSGAGKTTLVDIIAGLFEPTEGEILLDNKKQDLPQDSPLKIGYIPQEFNIINGSIRENVSFGASKIDDNRVVDALKKAQLYDFIINHYEEGIYANPFVDSTGLSQGQKQRLAIARALYAEPDVLILDEATSSLDLKTEEEICNVLNSLKGNVTIIAIAHRLSTIKSADKIVFMKNGEIIDIAPFDELVCTNSDFKELVDIASFK